MTESSESPEITRAERPQNLPWSKPPADARVVVTRTGYRARNKGGGLWAVESLSGKTGFETGLGNLIAEHGPFGPPDLLDGYSGADSDPALTDTVHQSFGAQYDEDDAQAFDDAVAEAEQQGFIEDAMEPQAAAEDSGPSASAETPSTDSGSSSGDVRGSSESPESADSSSSGGGSDG